MFNMKKKTFLNLWLMAALTLGLAVSVTSCKDDDDDNTSEQRNEDADPLDTDENMVAWRWLSLLTDAGTLDEGWASKTYTPNIGVASENNQNTRIVTVADLDEAKAKFADLAGVETSRLAADYTASQSGVGSLQWSPSAAGADNLAEVAVSIRAIPSLQKIVYCTTDQAGKNGWGLGGEVDKTAYYRFGDVIRDRAKMQYWVCVRPAFAQGSKGESHWICVFNRMVDNDLPEENVYTKYNKVKKYDERTIKLPTKLAPSREHMQNLANLVYALLDPHAYATKVGTDENLHNNGLGGFDYKYHGERFLTNVARYWDNTTTVSGTNLWQLIFNRTHEQMAGMANMILLYNGYQWRVGQTGYVWEFKAPKASGFQRTAPGSESGDKVLYNFGGEGYDVTRYISSTGADALAGGPKQFADNGDYRWVVVHATGSELQKQGKYSPNEPINGFTDIYRYNQNTNRQVHDDLETEQTLEQQAGKALDAPKVGCIIGADGKFYDTKLQAENNSGKAVAIVVALTEKDAPLENGTDYNGMAMSLELTARAAMNAKDGYNNTCGLDETAKTWADMEKLLNGLTVSQNMAKGCGKGHDHPAVNLCVNFDPGLTAAGKALHNYSSWFMPSFGQWLVGIQAMGWELPESGSPKILYDENVARIKRLCSKRGVPYENAINFPFWTCSLDPDYNSQFIMAATTFLWTFNHFEVAPATVSDRPARPFILFEVDVWDDNDDDDDDIPY